MERKLHKVELEYEFKEGDANKYSLVSGDSKVTLILGSKTWDKKIYHITDEFGRVVGKIVRED